MPIPFPGLDGILLNLKTPGKEPHVIVNSTSPPLRQRFTMAHEIGHILIPWHAGKVFVDYADNIYSSYLDDWAIENEANAFAAQLLMPQAWVEEAISYSDDLSVVHKKMIVGCQVSASASAIRLSQFLPDGIVYASESNGRVEFSGRTEGTIANALEPDIEFRVGVFAYASERHYVSAVEGRTLHWWRLPCKIHIDSADERTWREILDTILRDICDTDQVILERKRSINGVVGSAFSKCIDRSDVGCIVSACVQRLHNRQEYEAVVRHDDFPAFIQKRAEALSAGAVTRGHRIQAGTK